MKTEFFDIINETVCDTVENELIFLYEKSLVVLEDTLWKVSNRPSYNNDSKTLRIYVEKL